MSSKIAWADLRCLNDRKGVPKGAGIYLIGVRDPSLADLGVDAEYFGKNYPVSFRPRYVGMTMSSKCGIATRLRSHALKRGNENIKNFILSQGIQDLYYTYSEHLESDFAEVIILGHQNSDFLNWNRKGELLGAAKRFALELGPPAPCMADHLEPWEQLQEFKIAKEIEGKWDEIMDENPKYKRIIEQRRGSGSP